MPGVREGGGGMSKGRCTHHWKIATPEGPTAEGHCGKCGATRTFETSSEGVFYSGRTTHEIALLGSTPHRGAKRSGK